MLRAATDHFSHSDTGRQRRANEDAYFARSPVFVVADGMGGHAAGDVASAVAVDTIEEAFSRLEVPDEATHGPFGPRTPARVAGEKLSWAVRLAARRIHDLAEKDVRMREMGTTVVALAFVSNHAVIANVGDSRCYLVRGDAILQLTEDHSVVAEQVRLGVIRPEQAKTSLLRNQLTRSVGYHDDVEVDRILRPVDAGDVFLLCSDGLSNLVDDQEVLALVTTREPHDAAQALVDLANERGGDDNVTVVIARVDELDPEPIAPAVSIDPSGLTREEPTETPLP